MPPDKLVSSISSALNYLVRKLQQKNFRAIADVTNIFRCTLDGVSKYQVIVNIAAIFG